jgi:hypothetical protein
MQWFFGCRFHESSFPRCGDDNERALPPPWPQRFNFPRFRQGACERLAPGINREAGFQQKPRHLVSRIERGLALKHILVLMRQIVLPQVAIPVYKADHQTSARLEYPPRLFKHPNRRVNKAEGGNH